MASRLAVFLLQNSRISNEERQLLTAAMLDKLGAIPIRARMIVDDVGRVFVDGKQTTYPVAKRLHETSKVLLNNFARRFVREQVAFMAVHKGVHENTSPEQGLFAKAVLWVQQEEEELLMRLAQTEVTET